MTKHKPYFRHLASSLDLVTSYEETRAGFIAHALEKTRRATPFVEEGRALKAAALQAPSPSDLVNFPEIQPALLTASGVSDKALTYMLPEDKAKAVQGLIETYLEPAGAAFADELVYRFLLTRGDALGGAMRNLAGAMAQRKLARASIAAFSIARRPFRWLDPASN